MLGIIGLREREVICVEKLSSLYAMLMVAKSR